MALAAALVLGTVAVAAGTEKVITVSPMTLSINGREVSPTKSDGSAAQVFAYDGATYVPLRYLSELLGIQVEWDRNNPDTAKLVDVPTGRFRAGTYTAKTIGMGGYFEVTVTFSSDAITHIQVGENS